MKKEKIPYWSYEGGRMYASDKAIEAYKEQSLKTYQDFIDGNFELEDILSEELLIKLGLK